MGGGGRRRERSGCISQIFWARKIQVFLSQKKISKVAHFFLVIVGIFY